MSKKFSIVVIISIIFISVFGFINFYLYEANYNHQTINEDKSDINKNITIDKNTPLKSDTFRLWSDNVMSSVGSVAISEDGEYMVVGVTNGMICLYRKSSSTPLWVFSASDSVETVDISSSGQYIVAGSNNGRVYVFSRISSTPLWSYNTGGYILSVAITSDGNYIAAGSGGSDDKLYYFSRSSSTPIWSYQASGNVQTVAISKNTGTFIAIGRGSTVHYFWTQNPTPQLSFSTGGYVEQVTISNNGQYYAAASNDNKIYFWYALSSTPLWSFDSGNDMYSISMSSNGYYIFSGGNNGNVYLFNRTSSIPIWSYDTNSPVYSADISSDGSTMIAENAYSDQGIYLFHRSDSMPLWKLQAGGINEVSNVAISSDGTYSIAGDASGGVHLIQTLHEPKSFQLDKDADEPDTNGIFNLLWTTSEYADSYSVYTSDTFITDINESVFLVEQGIQVLSYEISTIENKIHYFIVIAFNNYGNFSSNCISVDVQIAPPIPPSDFNLFSDADIPDSDGSFKLFWDQSKGADNYSVYVSNISIEEINENCTEIAYEIYDTFYFINNLLTGNYYYIVAAFNKSGSTLSNCIYINIQRTSTPVIPSTSNNGNGNGSKKTDDASIPFGYFYLPFILIGVVSLIIFMKRKL